MSALTLKRIGTDNDGTYGVLMDGNKPVMLTLEESWKGNVPKESCIPDGMYLCRRVRSPHFGETFEVTNVEGRSHILFHAGNTEIDTLGCILLGSEWGAIETKDDDSGEVEMQTAVLESRKAFNKFMALQQGVDEFNLWIVWAPGGA